VISVVRERPGNVVISEPSLIPDGVVEAIKKLGEN